MRRRTSPNLREDAWGTPTSGKQGRSSNGKPDALLQVVMLSVSSQLFSISLEDHFYIYVTCLIIGDVWRNISGFVRFATSE